MEFSGFLLVFFGSFILGHKNAVVTLILQSFCIFIFFNILPCIYLINDSDLKANFAETEIYFKFLQFFKCEQVDPHFLRNNDEDRRKKIENNDDNSK